MGIPLSEVTHGLATHDHLDHAGAAQDLKHQGVLDSGEAFTGDLTPPMLATEEAAAVMATSWETLRSHGATMVYPGHGPIRPALPTVSR